MKYRAITTVALVAAFALIALVGRHGAADAGTSRVCFPASHWDASNAKRPCVQVTRVEEDGSFSYRVTDADGVERYTAGIGALDR